MIMLTLLNMYSSSSICSRAAGKFWSESFYIYSTPNVSETQMRINTGVKI